MEEIQPLRRRLYPPFPSYRPVRGRIQVIFSVIWCLNWNRSHYNSNWRDLFSVCYWPWKDITCVDCLTVDNLFLLISFKCLMVIQSKLEASFDAHSHVFSDQLFSKNKLVTTKCRNRSGAVSESIVLPHANLFPKDQWQASHWLSTVLQNKTVGSKEEVLKK
jgi:hypothetical protein